MMLQEVCSSMFAAICNIQKKNLSQPHLNQLKTLWLTGEGAPGLWEEDKSCLGSCLHGIPYTHMLHLLWIRLVNISSAISIRLSLVAWVCGSGVHLSTFGVASLAGSVGLPSSSSTALSGFVFS